MTSSTTVAPRLAADDHSTRWPFPEVTGLPPGTAASTDPNTAATASLSADGHYRWVLTRRWAKGPVATWILLNPSTADGQADDPTLRRVIGFTRSAGYAQVTLANLYAWRSPSPHVLRQVEDPVGPDNDREILAAASQADLVVVAWGTHARADRAETVLDLLRHRPVWCLGRTSSGQPRHPLYVPARTPFEVYRPERHDWDDWTPIADPGTPEPLRERICPTCHADQIDADYRRQW